MRSILDLRWSAELAGCLEAASSAVGRLDALISASFLKGAWSVRAAWSGRTQALRLVGTEVDEIDIFGQACDVDLSAVRRHRITLEDTGLDVGSSDSASEALALRIAQARQDPDWQRRPALLRAFEITAHQARLCPGAAAWLTMPACLQQLGLTRTRLPNLVAGTKLRSVSARDHEAAGRRFLRNIESLASDGLRQLHAMEQDRVRALRAIANETRPGLLAHLVDILIEYPVLRPRQLASRLKLTISGAGKLLARAERLGLVVEISGRQSWRTYLARDLAVRYRFAAPHRGRPVNPPSPAAQPLDEALAKFDQALAAFDQSWGRGDDDDASDQSDWDGARYPSF